MGFDINTDKTGAINPDHIAQVKAVSETFNKVKKVEIKFM